MLGKKRGGAEAHGSTALGQGGCLQVWKAEMGRCAPKEMVGLKPSRGKGKEHRGCGAASVGHS